MIYDGHCKVCGRSVKLLAKWDRNHALEILPSETPGLSARFPWISPRDYAESVQLVRGSDGKTWQAAAALEELLSVLPKGALISWLFRIPLVRPLVDRFYRWFARNRYHFGCGQHCRVRARSVALIAVLAGTLGCAGTYTPVPQPAGPHLTRGMATADSLVDAAVGTLIPGAVLVVARNGIDLRERAFGYAELNDYELRRLAAPRVMRTSTQFDLASVTKVMATTFASAEVVDRFLLLDKYQNYLGWRLPRAMPTGSFDHTGFAGTYVLGVPRYKLSIVLLTNRQNLGTNARGYFPDLAGLQGAVAKAIVDGAAADETARQR